MRNYHDMNTKVHLRLTSLLVNVSLSILLCLLEGYLRKGEAITVEYIHIGNTANICSGAPD